MAAYHQSTEFGNKKDENKNNSNIEKQPNGQNPDEVVSKDILTGNKMGQFYGSQIPHESQTKTTQQQTS